MTLFDKLAPTPIPEREAVDGPVARARDGWLPLWMIAGAAWVAFVVQGLVRWVGHPTEFGPAPILGPDVYDPGLLVFMRVVEVISIVISVATIWVFLVRPLRRTGRLTLDGKIVIGSLLASFIDPLINYFHYTFAWNAHALNLGSWLSVFPMAQGPSHYGEGLVWFIPQYLYLGIGLAAIEGRIIQALRRRSPSISNVRAFAVACSSIFVLDCVIEQLFIRTGIYAFPRTWGSLTLFAGTPYQFPIYESIFVAAYATGFTWLRMSAIDDPEGLSFVERGVQRWRPQLRTAATLLGIIGFCFVWAALSYFLPWSWMSNNPDSLIQVPSYMMPGPQ